MTELTKMLSTVLTIQLTPEGQENVDTKANIRSMEYIFIK